MIKKQAKRERLISRENTFQSIACERWDNRKDMWNPEHAQRIWAYLNKDIFPHIVDRPITEIEGPGFCTPGVIGRRSITVTVPDGVTKAFDGNSSVPSHYLPVVSGGIGEGISSALLAYDSAGAGTHKWVNISDVIMDDGNGGQNYDIILVPSNTGRIDPIADTLPVMSTVERNLPGNILLADIEVAVAKDGRLAQDFVELGNVRAQLPEIVAITSVAAIDGAALPAGARFDPATARLSFAAGASVPQYLTAIGLDRNHRPRHIRVRITTGPQAAERVMARR